MIREEMNDEKRKEEEVKRRVKRSKEVKGKQVAATLRIREMYGIEEKNWRLLALFLDA